MATLFRELSLSAQTAYAELLEQARAQDLQSLSGLVGAFHRRTIKGHEYVYFGYRDGLKKRVLDAHALKNLAVRQIF